MKLIVIEDELSFAELLKRTLDGLPESFTVVSDWNSAFELIEKENHELAWVDLRMPGSNEEETIKRIELLRRQNSNIVIIVGSGFITPEIRAKLDRAGADGVFYKGGEYDSRQVASLIILSMMKAKKRNPDFNDVMLKLGMGWMHERFPDIVQ